ncbi:DHS-like NAD/FAD-binding domain-containing protein [Meredithblackwellia eburnea MCA 4105]
MPIRIPNLTGQPHPPAPSRTLKQSIELVNHFLTNPSQSNTPPSPTGGTVILTGAGVSVDSGIRAYRGKNGSYTVNKKHRPIFYHEFVESESHRKRYWARSFLGYVPVRNAEPNPTHYAIAALQKMRVVDGLITQNVDGLHHKACDTNLATYLSPSPSLQDPSEDPLSALSSRDPSILELHGTLRHVHCLSCGTPVGRDDFQDRLSILNPEWKKYSDEVELGGRQERLNPDGDVELGPGIRYEEFNVPACETCGGDMKPKVTFFGESLSPQVRSASHHMIHNASQLLIIGSSLATFSAFRLVRQKKDEGGPVGLVNVGESRGDGVVDWRVGWEGGAGEILPDVVRALLESREWEEALRREVEDMLARGKVKQISGTRATT